MNSQPQPVRDQDTILEAGESPDHDEYNDSDLGEQVDSVHEALGIDGLLCFNFLPEDWYFETEEERQKFYKGLTRKWNQCLEILGSAPICTYISWQIVTTPISDDEWPRRRGDVHEIPRELYLTLDELRTVLGDLAKTNPLFALHLNKILEVHQTAVQSIINNLRLLENASGRISLIRVDQLLKDLQIWFVRRINQTHTPEFCFRTNETYQQLIFKTFLTILQQERDLVRSRVSAFRANLYAGIRNENRRQEWERSDGKRKNAGIIEG